jgi:hypothetical protein
MTAVARRARRRRARFSVEQLPFDDRACDALPDDERRLLSQHWLRRCRSEARISEAFHKMQPFLHAVGADPIVLELLELASEDELRHSGICLKLAEHYAGARLAPPATGDTPLPQFGCADERLEAALLVAGTCCINETLATAWLQLSVTSAHTPLSKAAHRAHLRDEIDHARLGWAHLGSAALDGELRDAVADCVPRLLAANLPLWLTTDPLLPANGIAGHGVAPAAVITRAMQRAVDELLLPGFAHVGVHLRP